MVEQEAVAEPDGSEAATAPTDRSIDGDELRVLRETASTLVKTISGPVASISLRSGQCALEITWEHRLATPSVLPGSPPPASADDDSVREIVAPLVGTFYVAAEPGSAPFVTPNTHVPAGSPIGIVEAMKLMNRVTSDWAGEVLEILVADGESVEFGQPLVRIKLDPQ